MLKEYIRKQIIKFIEGELDGWVTLYNIEKDAYARADVQFAGSKDQIYLSHIINAYKFLISRARLHDF